MVRSGLVGALAALLFTSVADAAPAPQAWLGTWAAAPSPPVLVEAPRRPASAKFSNVTLRQVVRISAGGSKVRVRFTNEYGSEPLRIGAARIGLAGEGGAVRAGTGRALTFGGRPTAVVPPGAPLVSDPVDMPVEALASLAVSLYLPEGTGPCTCHPVGAQTGFAAQGGDFTAQATLPNASSFLFRAFLSGVEVTPAAPASAVVVLGDSISDGTVSTPDRNQRWPDRLAERLNERDRGRRAWGVVNAGISGNRLLTDGPGAGVGALARFDRDVLAVPGAAYVVVLIGVNDLGVAHGPPREGAVTPSPTAGLTAEDMIAGYRQLIDRAHARGLKIYGATITPYRGATYWSEKGEAQRQAINRWIRTSGAYDGVIDFDAAWRDPAKPTEIAEPLRAADHLHGSDLGYRTLGNAVDLGLFR